MFSNYESDEDFIKLYKSITTFFAYYVVLARKYSKFYENSEFLLEYLRQKNLILLDDESFSRLTFYMENYFSEIRKRGTMKIIERTGKDESESFSDSGWIDENLNGELLRLISFEHCDEFIFNLRKGNKIGFNIANSSPLYRGTSNMENCDKIWSQLLDSDDYLNFPLINSDYITSVQDSIDDDFDISQSWSESDSSTFIDEDYVIKIIPTSNTNPIGIGLKDSTNVSKANAYGIVVNPLIDYEFKFRIKANKLRIVTPTNNLIATISPEGSPNDVITNAAGTIVYVANYGDITIDVIDASNNTITHTIVLTYDGAHPWDMVLNHDESVLYITSRSNGLVILVNAITNTVGASIPVGTTPYCICISPDGAKLYVTDNDPYVGKVYIISTGSNTVIGHIDFPYNAQCYGICISPDGTKLYVANFGLNTISVINTTSNTIIATITVDINPQGICISPDGKTVYVSCYGDATVSVINAVSNTFIGTIPVGVHPYDIVISEDGSKVYVTNNAGDTVSVIDTQTGTVVMTINTGANPSGVAISPDGTKLYVNDFADSNTEVFEISDDITNDYNIVVGCDAFDCDGNQENLESIIDQSTISTELSTIEGLLQTDIYYSFRGIIYSNKRFNDFDNSNSYKQNTIVFDSGTYYRAKIYVPIGTLISNITYWTALTTNELNDLLYPHGYSGHNLKFTNNVKKIVPYIKVTSQSSDLIVWLANIKLQPVATDYSSGFIQIMNWIDFWMTINNQNYTEDQVKQLLREFLLPYDAQDFEFNQPILE